MKELTLNSSKKNVFEAVKNAAQNLELEIQQESLVEGALLFFKSAGLFSFGNKINVEIINSESLKTILKVSSKSAAAVQIIDWGTNNNIEIELINEVKNILS